MTPLMRRIFAAIDVDSNESLDFGEFLGALSLLTSPGQREAKLEFAFRLYDLDGDGYIGNSELFKVMSYMVADNLDDTQLQQVVDKTIRDADTDGDGRLSKAEFMDACAQADTTRHPIVSLKIPQGKK
ncbi:hypothetical protein KIPB_000283 [Kipferlia bialata]|uniref:EF-hand domain-containing protein n=1 Tax=Kipferlia bialata TaxID=797122 RepID=A0A9K3CP06_9EUKA|nr:hypothetical protein KIPB_000283 [Kipferlia bialata]|eukprot:g283.t1